MEGDGKSESVFGNDDSFVSSTFSLGQIRYHAPSASPDNPQCLLKPSPTWGAMFVKRKVSSIASWRAFGETVSRAGQRLRQLVTSAHLASLCISSSTEVTSVVARPEVILESCPESRWHLRILLECRVGSVDGGDLLPFLLLSDQSLRVCRV